MEIRLARSMGFCFGVKRAVSTAQRAASERGPVTTLGPLVHNDQMVGRLKEAGVDVAKHLADVPAGPVVISAHGVGRATYEEARERKLEVIDATCPIVRQVQRRARDLAAAGYLVVVLGDRDHSEVRGVVGWTDGQAYVVGSVEELAALPRARKVAVLSQSTLTLANFNALVAELITRHMDGIQELVVHKTLCNATTSAQASALELAQEVGTIIVIGGRSSANTRHLAEVCAETGVPTYHIEEAGEIKPEWLDVSLPLGITAGASTPDWVIEEVVARVELLAAALEGQPRPDGGA